jgi:hypothetical protein
MMGRFGHLGVHAQSSSYFTNSLRKLFPQKSELSETRMNKPARIDARARFPPLLSMGRGQDEG